MQIQKNYYKIKTSDFGQYNSKNKSCIFYLETKCTLIGDSLLTFLSNDQGFNARGVYYTL